MWRLLIAIPALAVTLFPSLATAAEGGTNLALCEAGRAAASVHEAAQELADHVADGYSEQYPGAVAITRSLAAVASTLDAQLRESEPARVAYFDAWAAFQQSLRRSPLPRDPALRSVLSPYRQSAAELEAHLGCEPEVDRIAMVPCSSIPVAHLLAVVSEQVRAYIAERYAESYSDQAEVAAELAASSRHLHEVLHDLEVVIPATLGVYRTLVTSFVGSALTDTEDPADVAVKARLAALGDAISHFEPLVASCHASAGEAAGAEHEHP